MGFPPFAVISSISEDRNVPCLITARPAVMLAVCFSFSLLPGKQLRSTLSWWKQAAESAFFLLNHTCCVNNWRVMENQQHRWMLLCVVTLFRTHPVGCCQFLAFPRQWDAVWLWMEQQPQLSHCQFVPCFSLCAQPSISLLHQDSSNRMEISQCFSKYEPDTKFLLKRLR